MEENKIKKLYFIGKIFVLLLLITGCNQKPTIDINKVLIQSAERLKELDEIETTASAFDGKGNIKFRLMVEGHPTEEEATFLFNKIIESIIEYSNHLDIWDYYNGYFDIKSYDNDVIYEATKLIGKDLVIMSVQNPNE